MSTRCVSLHLFHLRPRAYSIPVRQFSSSTTRQQHAHPQLGSKSQLNRNESPSTHIARDVLSALSLPNSPTPIPLTIAAHVRTIRVQKDRSFIALGDGSTTRSLQAIIPSGSPLDTSAISTGTSVRIQGLWQQCPASNSTRQSHELVVENLLVLGEAPASTYPLQKKYHTPEYLRGIPHLRLRIPSNALVARLRSEFELLTAVTLRGQGFVKVNPPIVTGSDCEGAGETFTLTPSSDAKRKEEHFFRTQKYLSVSGQLHLEAFVHEHRAVWTLAPTFRAERSETPRHLSEFWMLEAEVRTESLDEVMDLLEGIIRDVTAGLKGQGFLEEVLSLSRGHTTKRRDAVPEASVGNEELEGRWAGILRGPWPRVEYTSVIEDLQRSYDADNSLFNERPSWEHGLQTEHERFVASTIGRGGPVFVINYPASLKPFYMTRSSSPSDLSATSERETVSNFDLLVPEMCELAGGSLREHRLRHLVAQMRSKGLNLSEKPESERVSMDDTHHAGTLDWYLDLRRYGSVPHGGFGLGLDRLLAYLAGLDTVKDVVAWPRWVGRAQG